MDKEKKNQKDCSGCENEVHYMMSARTQKMRSSLISRLNRIEGQVRGIKGMVEKDVYCDDILNQISAVQSAMKSVSRLILESHMKGCLVNRIQSGETEVVDELLQTIEKMMR